MSLLILKLDPVIKDWRRKLKRIGADYALIRTTKVMHDKAAVVEESDKNITVEYPRSKEVKGKAVWSIRKDVIPRREIVRMRLYDG
jgi:hypothetical protein